MTRAKAGLDAVKAAPAPRDPVATLTTYDDANAAIERRRRAGGAGPAGESRSGDAQGGGGL